MSGHGNDDLAIRCTGVQKAYRRFSRKRKFQTLKSALLGGELLRDLSPEDLFHVLGPLDLAVPKGQALGVVGANGSGKSTLMKILYGTSKPSTGEVVTKGRISALIELGAGFHPEISGRENVAINGIMLGLSRREVARRFDEIVAFAELEEFIDAPVKTYSSGMYARLGFAVAISVSPDILLVDEVLSVGDESFSHKCVERIRAFKAQGRTIVLVTHDLAMVERICDRAVWIQKGKIMDDGEPRRVIDAYRLDVARVEDQRLEKEHHDAAVAIAAAPVPEPPPEAPSEEPAVAEQAAEAEAVREIQMHRWGSREVEIVAVALCGDDGEPRHVFASGEAFEIRLSVVPRNPVDDFVFGIGIFNEAGVCVYGTNTKIERMRPDLLDGATEVVFRVESLDLLQGTYQLDIAAHREDSMPYDYHSKLYSFRVSSELRDVGIYRPRHSWRFGGGVKFRE